MFGSYEDGGTSLEGAEKAPTGSMLVGESKAVTKNQNGKDVCCFCRGMQKGIRGAGAGKGCGVPCSEIKRRPEGALLRTVPSGLREGAPRPDCVVRPSHSRKGVPCPEARGGEARETQTSF